MLEIYDFGIRLKELRAKKQSTQKELAVRLGVTPKTISEYERNLLTPRLDTLIELAVLYNTSIDYMLGLDKRTQLHIDDLPPTQQEAILRIVEAVRKEFENLNK